MKEQHNSSLLSDTEVIKKITTDNNLEWFGVLYDRYSKVVYAKCLSFVKNSSEAEDLTHDIFIKVFMHLRSFNGQSKFSTWLYSLSYHHCVNHVNRTMKKRPETVNLEDQESEDEPDDKVLLEMQLWKLNLALDMIDPEDKMILLLKYHDEVSVKELCSILDLGESAVKMRLKRAKTKCVAAYRSIRNEPQQTLLP